MVLAAAGGMPYLSLLFVIVEKTITSTSISNIQYSSQEIMQNKRII
jgi:hypothetical protein